MNTAPEPKDVQEFQFKEASIVKISDGFNAVPPACSLIVSDGKRGLLYVGCDNKITVLKGGSSLDSQCKIDHILPAKVTRLALSCDSSFLAVAAPRPAILIYNAASLTKSLELLHEVRISSSSENVLVTDIRWNPCTPSMLCTVASDHTLGSFQIKEDKTMVGLTALERLKSLDVLCIAWSPKGKQIVAGCRNGDLVQLKPDLQVARTIKGPNPSIGAVIAILWISNYQFCAAYLDPNESRVNVLIVDAPKGEASGIFTCYEDITYGLPGVEGEEGGPRYYIDIIPEWNIIVAASSCSCEVAVLGSRDGGATWEQWQLIDSGRAQLPLVRTSESYPVGIAIDRSSVCTLPWGGEGTTLAHPVPVLHILGTSGQLCSFNMVNLMPNAPAVCSAPEQCDIQVCSAPTGTVSISAEPEQSFVPGELSFAMNSGVTSTPLPKPPNTSAERPKNVVPSNLFGVPTKAPVPQAPIEVNVPKVHAEKVEVPQRVEPKSLPPLVKETKPQEKIGLDDSVCIRAYREEHNLFEKELTSRIEPLLWDIGSDAERMQLVEKSNEVDTFLRELQDTTASLNSDISYLKALLLQSFAWLEETKSKCASEGSSNARSLSDNIKLAELQRMLYYAQSQHGEATRVLDLAWSDHNCQDNSRMKVPCLEFIYQSMVRHSQIIVKTKNLLLQQSRKWKSLTRGDPSIALNRSMASLNLSSSASFSNVNATSNAMEQRCKAIASRYCSFSREKQNKLRNLLSGNSIRSIRAAKPTSVQDRLEATLAALASISPPAPASRVQQRPERQPEETLLKTPPAPQAAKSPLACMDRIVASIGSAESQTQNNNQNRSLPVGSQQPATTQAENVTRTVPAFVPQNVPTYVPQMVPTKPKQVTASPFNLTKQGSQVQAFAAKASPKADFSTFASPAAKTDSLLPSSPQTTKAFPKVDSISFGSRTPKTQAQVAAFSSAGTLPTIAATPTAAAVSSSSSGLGKPHTSFSFSAPAQSPVLQVPSAPVPPKATVVATTVTTAVPAATPASIHSFSFASKAANPAAFSFASKATGSPTIAPQPSLDLSGLTVGLQGSSPPGSTAPAVSAAAASNIFGSLTPSTTGKLPSGSSPSSIFSNTSNSGASIFGATAPTTSPGSIFGGSSISSSTTPAFGSTLISSPTLQAPDASTASPGSPVFGGTLSSNTPAPAFGRSPIAAPTASIFGGSTNSPATSSATPQHPFGTASPSASVFGSASNTPSTASIFGGPPNVSSTTSVFGGSSSGTSSVAAFGGPPSSPSTASIFGGASATSSGTSIFGGASTGPVAGSVFGGAASSSSPAAATAAGVAAPSAFGQAPAFGTKPTFGVAPSSIFGTSKPVFGGFETSTFGASATTAGGFGGFGSPPSIGGNPPAVNPGTMQNVFGGATGSNTFESLAGQSESLSFGSLAQKQAEPEEPPAFSGGVSFTSWR